ncbi:hypothetical protein H6F56_03325 [Microcoleus sp. FACHB-672]|nr:hypothetical protein [Microcoleus sp. FACHB-672]
MTNKTITVWFSCGVASAVAAKKTIELYGKNNKILVVNNPVKEEHEDNKRFLLDVQEWLGVEILSATNSKYPNCSAVEVWEKEKFMSSPHGAPCTAQLKKIARYQFEATHLSHYLVMGFTAEERLRHLRLMAEERDDLLPVLINLGLSKEDCFGIVMDAGIKLPYIYLLNFPNANCIGCPKSESPTYWNLVRQHFPEIYAARAKQSRKIGCKLVKVKGERIFLDELSPETKGGKIKSWDCGIFCDVAE